MLGTQDRHRIIADLYPDAGSTGHWWFRFSVMLTLSVVIAVLGLSLDSDAVVIGAMLIAPLMTPITGTAAALVMGWPRRLAQSGLAVLAGSGAAVGISYLLTLLLPGSGQQLTQAMLSRTSPDLRDLGVALAAGAAGAYATAREDVSAALPGVAVAVALVPPLATVGFTLAIGREDLAGGAVLLFVANLVAIVLISSVVLAGSGIVPQGRYRTASGRIRFGLVSAVAALVLVAAPLTEATLASDSNAQLTRAVNQAAVSWLAPYPSLTLTGASITGSLVSVEVTGPTSPPSSTSLAQALAGVLGPGAAVQVQWFQTTTAGSDHSSATLSLTLAQLRPIVESWLSGEASTLRVAQLTKNGSTVSVTLEGTSAPPPADQLAKAISARAGQPATVSVTWRAPAPATVPSAAPISDTQKATTALDSWLAANPGLQLLGMSETGSTLTIDLAGTSPAQLTPALQQALSAHLGPDVTIAFRFAQLTPVTVTPVTVTPSATPPTASPASPASHPLPDRLTRTRRLRLPRPSRQAPISRTTALGNQPGSGRTQGNRRPAQRQTLPSESSRTSRCGHAVASPVRAGGDCPRFAGGGVLEAALPAGGAVVGPGRDPGKVPRAGQGRLKRN